MSTLSTLDIRIAATADEARAALAEGYEPVECAFGSESVVGPLGLDHHGALSDRPPVCRQALDLHSGARLASFVVTGIPDADATMAMALLAQRSIAGLGGDDIVALVAASDVGRWKDLSAEGRAGAIVLAWHARQRIAERRPNYLPPPDVESPSWTWHDCDQPSQLITAAGSTRAYTECSHMAALRWIAAVQDWPELLALPWPEATDLTSDEDPAPGRSELIAARESEAERARLARSATVTPYATGDGSVDGAHVALIESPVMGADVWYADHPGLRGYVAWQAETERVSISLRPSTARGEGLLALLGVLPQLGWGGRPEIIGSPRRVMMTREDAVRAAKLLATRIDEVSTS